MRRHSDRLKKGWRIATLTGALLLAVIIPAPHQSGIPGQVFSVMSSDFATPMMASPRGIQMLNAQMGLNASFAGYDQIYTLVGAGSTRDITLVTRYSGDIHSLLSSDFLMRAKPGTIEHPAIVSEEFWKKRLGGSPDVIGQTIEAARERFVIAGVVRGGGALLGETEVWLPVSSRGPFATLTSLRILGQLQPGVGWSAGERRLEKLIATDALQEQVYEAGPVHLLPIDRGLVISGSRVPQRV